MSDHKEVILFSGESFHIPTEMIHKITALENIQNQIIKFL